MSRPIKKSPTVLAYEADPVGTLELVLLDPIESYWRLSDLREHFAYDHLVVNMTQAMASGRVHKRFSGDQWAADKELLQELSMPVLALLFMPSILTNLQNLQKSLSELGGLGYKPADALEVIDLYIARDIDVYAVAEVLSGADRHMQTYLSRLKHCGDTLKAANALLPAHTPWYKKSVDFKLANDAVSKVATRYLLKQGPDGEHAWAYPAALARISSLDFGTKSPEYLSYIDSFLSCGNQARLHDPDFVESLEKIYSLLFQRYSMDNTDGKAWWILQAIKEFHRIFHVPSSHLVKARRDNPGAYNSHLVFPIKLIKEKPDYESMGILAELVSTLVGEGDPYKVGRGTMKDALAQLAYIPLDRLRTPSKHYTDLKAYLDKLFAGEKGLEKIRAAMDETIDSTQARFYGHMFPEQMKHSKNPWIRDQRMGQDLGL